MSDIRLQRLSKSYGRGVAVKDVDLQVQQGEFFSLLGPSGCGKSTTLRMIAGFIRPSGGRILLGGDDVTNLPPEKRGIGIVFQNYAIFPHMSVAENIAFGLVMRKVDRATIRQKVAVTLAQVGLSGYDDRYQRQLSGGEQQRVALARVLVTEPRILLLDEPLSALDKSLREEMKFWIKELQQGLGITTIYVTHDQDEALTMSDRIGVMNKSVIMQVGTPRAIYEAPESLFVTTFIGHSNIFDVTMRRRTEAGAVVELGGFEVPSSAGPSLVSGAAAKLVIRPENIRIFGEDETSDLPIRLPATILSETYQGAILRYRLDVGGQVVIAERQNQSQLARFSAGQAVTVGWDPDRGKALQA
jgi:putative spermidine/putrescine transport system ATP-binding protein